MSKPLNIAPSTNARKLVIPADGASVPARKSINQSFGEIPPALPPAQTSLLYTLIGSGMIHVATASLIFASFVLLDSSEAPRESPSGTFFAVTLAPLESKTPEINQESDVPEPVIPERTETLQNTPAESHAETEPMLVAYHTTQPRLIDSPPIEFVTVAEGPQFPISNPPPEPEKPDTPPKPTNRKSTPPKKADSPPKRRPSSKKTTTPPGSIKKKKSSPPKPVAGKSRNVRLRSRPSVRYPKQAKAAGIQGRCTIEVTVNSSGRVSSARVVRSSGNRSLDSEALRCARSARFHPAMRNGQTLTAKARLPFSFRI